MAQLKKKIAKLALQGISILGMLFGFSLVYFSIAIVFYVPRGDLAHLCASLGLLAILLVLGLPFIYTSYLMFRGKAFGAIELIATVLAIFVFGSVVDPVYLFAAKSVSGIHARTVVGLASCLATLSLSVLVYLICTRLLKRLVKVAYHPEKVSETRHSKEE